MQALTLNIDVNGCSCLVVPVKAPVVPCVVADDLEESQRLAVGAIAAVRHRDTLLCTALVAWPGPLQWSLTAGKANVRGA